MTQNSLEQSETEAKIENTTNAIKQLEASIGELELNIPVLEQEEIKLKEVLEGVNNEIQEIENKNKDIDDEIDKINAEAQCYECSLPKLIQNYNTIVQEVEELARRRGN